MSHSNQRDSDRLAELLADEAAAALAADEQRELDELARQVGPGERDAYLHAASLVQVSCLRQDRRPASRLPTSLRNRLAEQGQTLVARQRGPAVADIGAARERKRNSQPGAGNTAGSPPPTARTTSSIPARAGWAVAACLAVALAGIMSTGNGPASSATGGAVAGAPGSGLAKAASPGTDRSALLAQAGTVQAAFAPSDARYQNVTGDVVWNDRTQTGYMRLAGLPVNDPAKAQYQLWIIDPDRDRHPVDGGVFDVTETGEVLVPIQAKLAVGDPTTFAITLEQPGGVVVSAGPLLVVASVG